MQLGRTRNDVQVLTLHEDKICISMLASNWTCNTDALSSLLLKWACSTVAMLVMIVAVAMQCPVSIQGRCCQYHGKEVHPPGTPQNEGGAEGRSQRPDEQCAE